MRKEYALTEENEEPTLIEEKNWETRIRPGMRVSLNMVVPVSLGWRTNHCPKCDETTFGHSLPGKRIKW